MGEAGDAGEQDLEKVTDREIPAAEGARPAIQIREAVDIPEEQDPFKRYRDAVRSNNTEEIETAGAELDTGMNECFAKIEELRLNKLVGRDKVNRYRLTSTHSDGEEVEISVTDVPTDRPVVLGRTSIRIERTNPGVDENGRKKGRSVGSVTAEQVPGFKKDILFMGPGSSSSYENFQLPEPRRDFDAYPTREDSVPNPVAKAKEFLDMIGRGTVTDIGGPGNWTKPPSQGQTAEGSSQP